MIEMKALENIIRLKYGPGALCRMDREIVQTIADDRNCHDIITASCVAILLGTMCYGAVFGVWRSAIQACYSALKMPVLIYSVTLSSALINVMLAQVMGSRLSFRQVCVCILLSLAIASVLLGALSPIMLFFVFQSPSPDSENAMFVYRALLIANTAVVGLCGIIGSIRLYQLLQVLTNSARISARVLLVWILVSGLVGCELSWIISPFLARPDVPTPFFNPNAFKSNFFEYLFRAFIELL